VHFFKRHQKRGVAGKADDFAHSFPAACRNRTELAERNARAGGFNDQAAHTFDVPDHFEFRE
jgi:hypothetical protein